ncbi:MAG: hypothetical protein WAU32_12820, partial [Thermoanaerobaculia bacterium]
MFAHQSLQPGMDGHVSASTVTDNLVGLHQITVGGGETRTGPSGSAPGGGGRPGFLGRRRLPG